VSAASKAKILVWGAAGHALVVTDIIRLRDEYEIVAFLDDVDSSRWGQGFAGSVVRGGRNCLPELKAEGVRNAVIAIGDCAARLRIADTAREWEFELPTVIHPAAIVARGSTLGEGTVVAAQAVINPACSVGRMAIINTSATVDHECLIADGVHIGPGARLAGRVEIGTGAWIGVGATVKDRVRVGARSIIGAGSLVLKDVPEDVVAYGVPARIIRPNVEPQRQ
jgi:acetyltransferase EpsM